MKKIFSQLWLSAIAVIGIGMAISCGSSKTELAAFYEFETECIDTEYDGSLTIRVWGAGNTKGDAIEAAKKKAVREVIFSGITRGTSGENMRPLIYESNAEEKYQDYFGKFFADKGEYARFVNMKDEKTNSRQVFENAQTYKYGITVRVLRSDLRKKLQQDGIIK